MAFSLPAALALEGIRTSTAYADLHPFQKQVVTSSTHTTFALAGYMTFSVDCLFQSALSSASLWLASALVPPLVLLSLHIILARVLSSDSTHTIIVATIIVGNIFV